MAFLACVASIASAEDIPDINVMGEDVLAKAARLKWGPCEFHPYLAVEAQGNDNILLSRSNAEDDVVATYVPGISMLVPLGRHSVTAKYQLLYRDYAALDELDNFQHRAEFEAKLDFKRFYFRLQDRFAVLREPIDIQIAQMVDRVANDADIVAGLRLNRWTFELAGTFRIRDYREKDLDYLDYMEYRGSLEAGYEFTPRTSVFGRYTYDQTAFVDNLLNDFCWHAAVVGMRGSITRKLTWEAAAGVAYVKKTEDNVDFAGEDSSDVDFYAKAGLTWTPIADRMTLNLAYERTPSPSTISTFLILDRLSFQFRHSFTKALSVSLDASYEMAHRSRGPDLTRWSYGPGVQFRIREWLMLYGRYAFVRCDSNRDGPEYKNNFGSVGLLVAF